VKPGHASSMGLKGYSSDFICLLCYVKPGHASSMGLKGYSSDFISSSLYLPEPKPYSSPFKSICIPHTGSDQGVFFVKDPDF